MGWVLAGNVAMLGLARSMGFSVKADAGDATVVQVRGDLASVNLNDVFSGCDLSDFRRSDF